MLTMIAAPAAARPEPAGEQGGHDRPHRAGGVQGADRARPAAEDDRPGRREDDARLGGSIAAMSETKVIRTFGAPRRTGSRR